MRSSLFLYRKGEVCLLGVKLKIDEDSFWSKVTEGDYPDGDFDTPCWIWQASKKAKGYGSWATRIDGKKETVRAHRVAYQLMVAEIPDGLVLDHLCRVTDCVNPYHLDPVTNRVNLARGIGPSAINASRTRCVNGHEFTEENTYSRKNRYGVSRECRECQRTRARARYARDKSNRKGVSDAS